MHLTSELTLVAEKQDLPLGRRGLLPLAERQAFHDCWEEKVNKVMDERFKVSISYVKI